MIGKRGKGFRGSEEGLKIKRTYWRCRQQDWR